MMKEQLEAKQNCQEPIQLNQTGSKFSLICKVEFPHYK